MDPTVPSVAAAAAVGEYFAAAWCGLSLRPPPANAVWPLPAYELAILTAGEARAMARDDLEITVLTPEAAPLSLFGPQASAAMIEELEIGRAHV